jgi:2-polyprenyl-3-methyl-5-hydroxy-6-metoxy-1,4-benzoquinol methylase
LLELIGGDQMNTIRELPRTAESADGIRTRLCPRCYLCQAQGEPLYENLADCLFGVPGTWNLMRCPNSNCGMAWLNPVPLEEDIGKAYAKYYTHGDTPMPRTWFAEVMRRRGLILRSLANPVQAERESLFLMHLDNVKPGKLLDVGCGDGVRLARLRALGWDVCGQDVDPVAVAYARETLGLEANSGQLKDLPYPESSFDCVTLNHVIEHTHDPVGLLEESRRFLKTGGLLVVITPNVSSFAHKHFGRFWRGLEPPRHIHLFSPKTLATTAAKAGFTGIRVRTTVGNAQIFAHGSLAVKNGGTLPFTPLSMFLREIYSLGCLYRSVFEHIRDTDSGEECVLQATH